MVVMDKDELLEDGALLGVPITDLDAAPIWPAYNRMWSRIINMVRRAGLPVIHLSTTPSPQDFAARCDSDGPVHWVLLDCSDHVRLARLRERAWSAEWIADAMEDAIESRTLIPDVIRTDDAEPQVVARRVLAWIGSIDDRLNEVKHD
jgi:hypothetical protein